MVQDLLVREFMISANSNITMAMMLQLTAGQCSPPGLPDIHVVAGAVSSIVTLVTSLATGPFGAVSKYITNRTTTGPSLLDMNCGM